MSNGKSIASAAEEDDEPKLSGCRKSLKTIFRYISYCNSEQHSLTI